MIAIYAMANDQRAREAYADLRKHSIPCSLIGPEYGHASVISKVPFLFAGRGCEEIVDGFHSSVHEIKIIRSYEALRADALMERLQSVYRLDFSNLTRGGIHFMENRFYFFGNRLELTEQEKLIVMHLTLCHGVAFNSDEIASFCLSGGKATSVAVHICNINAKNRASATERIIYSKRYQGYYVK